MHADLPLWRAPVSYTHLDVYKRQKVQSALSRLLAGKTVLVIAHRMRTVAGADRIVVLENGRVAPVSYTHLDVYKRQPSGFVAVGFVPKQAD